MPDFPYAAAARSLPTAAQRDHFAAVALRRRNRNNGERVEALIRHTVAVFK